MSTLKPLAILVAGAALLVSTGAAAADPPARLKLPFTKYTLPNGLTVILHQDKAVPLVVTNLTVKVGSRFEEPKRTGFAHLFEHLMFMGTSRVPTKMFDGWMEAEGGWNNAWTSEDRTGYFNVGPSNILPLFIWLESDRFGALGPQMTLDKLNAQRDVVRNERRQTTENTPYGRVELRMPELLYPPGHPYHHPVIGSHEDLQAATVDDVKQFFARWYVPNNASLVIAGDFDPEKTKAAVAATFGLLKRGDVPAAPEGKPVKLTKVVRETLQDNVAMPKVFMAWHSAPHFAPGDAEMDLVSVILQKGKASRLYKALVYDKAIAQEVKASQDSADLGSVFTVEAIPRKGVTLEKLEAAIDAELARLAKGPITAEELARAKNQYEMDFVARLQSVSERASMLNAYETKKGDPDYAEKDLERYRAVTLAQIQDAARKTLDLGARVIVRVLPKPASPGDAPKKEAP